MKIKRCALLISFGFYLGFVNCGKSGKDDNPDPTPEKGQIEIVLTDNPAFYSAINVNLSGLEYNSSADSTITTGWQVLPLNNPGIINLLSLQNGAEATLTNTQIDQVEIKQFRLKFGASGNSISDNGVTYPLIIPAAILQNGAAFPAGYKVGANESISIWIDFNAAASVLHDTVSNIYTLLPHLRSFDETQTGAIEGYIANPAAVSSVTIQPDSPMNAGFTSVCIPDPLRSGYFKSTGLPPGDYQVMVSVSAPGYVPRLIKPVSVTRGQTTSVGNISIAAQLYSDANQFVGNWKVQESVSKNIGGFVGVDSFSAHTILQNDSTFGIIQTARTPDPDWVLSVPYANADTLWFIPVTQDRILKNTYQGNIGHYSANKDTLEFTYTFGAPGNYFVYLVTQKWVKQ